MRSRMFEIVQQCSYLTEDQIKIGLAHKMIEKWAYVKHDKDVNEDGTPKEAHWHVVIKLVRENELQNVAKWFEVKDQYVEVKKGYGAFLDCCEYLTHESPEQQAKGKYRYPDEEINASFNFRAELNEKTIKRLKKAPKYSADNWCYDILMSGKRLYDCLMEDPTLYSKNISKLVQCRRDYLCRQKPPTSRINIYISGAAGFGKGLASRAIARQIARTYADDPDAPDDVLFFETGGANVTFDGYDGQPVIIWNDCRSSDLFKKLNSREEIFNVFDTHPTTSMHHVKFSAIRLANKINIINSVQPPDEFIKGLAGEYTDKSGEFHKSEDINQVRRRFVITLALNETDFDVAFNRGYFYNTGDYSEYEEYRHIRGSFKMVREKLNRIDAETIEAKMTERITQHVIDKFEDEENEGSTSETSVLEMFASYGTIEEPEVNLEEPKEENSDTLSSSYPDDNIFPDLPF